MNTRTLSGPFFFERPPADCGPLFTEQRTISMMFLYSAIRAEVEPVPGQAGWYQPTGRDITRWTIPAEDSAGDVRAAGVTLDTEAKIYGIHTVDEEIALSDPRFNHENDPEDPQFYVYTDPYLKKTFMMLNVNQAEAAIFRFLVPHESATADDDGDEYDPIENYRVEA